MGLAIGLGRGRGRGARPHLALDLEHLCGGGGGALGRHHALRGGAQLGGANAARAARDDRCEVGRGELDFLANALDLGDASRLIEYESCLLSVPMAVGRPVPLGRRLEDQPQRLQGSTAVAVATVGTHQAAFAASLWHPRRDEGSLKGTQRADPLGLTPEPRGWAAGAGGRPVGLGWPWLGLLDLATLQRVELPRAGRRALRRRRSPAGARPRGRHSEPAASALSWREKAMRLAIRSRRKTRSPPHSLFAASDVGSFSTSGTAMHTSASATGGG